jgi:CHAT domain-containing protein/tetratricopeptide (TPR) repeat protein
MSSVNRMRTIFVILFAGWLAQMAEAADGYMIRVTARRGEIKLGTTVLATVPKGTRLWAFEVNQDSEWTKVKVPGKDDKGWLSSNQIESIQHTDAEAARLDVAAAHSNRFELLYEVQKLTEAVVEMRQCLQIEREVLGAEHPDVADTVEQIGNCLRDQSDYAGAHKYLVEALTIRKKVLGSDHPDTALALNHLGNLAADQGDYNESRRYYDVALTIYRNVFGDAHSDTAMTLNNLGVLSADQGGYAAAQRYYDEALAIDRQVLGDEHVDTASTYNNLGELSRYQGNYVSARKFYDQALAIYRSAVGNEHTDTAMVLSNLGLLMADQGDISAARKYCDEALVIYRKVLGDEHRETARLLNNLGELAREERDWKTAQKYCDEALAIYRKVLGNDHRDTAMTLGNLGVLMANQEDNIAAHKYCDEALAIYQKTVGSEHPDTAMALNNLGELAQNEGRYPAARKYYEEALSIQRKVLGNEHPDTAWVINNLACLFVEDNYPQLAAESVDEARRIIRRYEARVLPALSEREQALFLAARHNAEWEMSLSFGQQQRDNHRIASMSAGWLVNGKAMAEEALAEGALLSGPEAAPLVERLRAVRTSLAQLSTKPGTADYQQKIAALETEQRELIRKIAAVSTGFSDDEAWVSIATLRGDLPASSIMVNIASFAPYDFKAKKSKPERYAAWLIPASEEGPVQIVDLGEVDPIDNAVTALRASLTSAKGKAARNTGSRGVEKAIASLTELIWKPLAGKLDGKEELILSPDGALWLVPWAALRMDDGKFLVEKYKLRYVISGRELVRRRIPRSGISPPVVLADPDYDLELADRNDGASAEATKVASGPSATHLVKVSRLPGSAREARAIQPSLAKLGGTAPVVFLGSQATESQFKALFRPRVLMLSTHGFFLADQKASASNQVVGMNDLRSSGLGANVAVMENPLLRCGLLLAGCNRRDDITTGDIDDGVLTGLEIVSADLRGTDLVVLSACDSGVGVINNGEGVAGLRQAFQLAGAKNVVATLWQIPDDETSQLMNDFFGYLSEGKLKAEALRLAQLNRIADYRENSERANPLFWAAFTLTGGE